MSRFLSDKMALPAYVAMLRYTSSFKVRDGTVNTIHILFRGDKPRKEVRMGSTPVVLEREVPRLGGLAPTTARVSLYADADGDFRELYSQPEGAVKLLIYHHEDLAYIGTLDPEVYEEDYTKRAGYMVDLVFSDFGVSKRLQHKYTGNKTLKEWVDIFVRDAIFPTRYGFSSDIFSTSSSFLVQRFFEGEDLGDDLLSEDFTLDDPEKRGDISTRAVISARAFYKGDNESLSIYESLDGLLASFAFTLSLVYGRALVTDRHYLLSRNPITAQVAGDDSVFSADESYTALNIDIEPRNDLQVVNYTHPTINDGEARIYPRLDRPDISAYTARLKPIPGCRGSYDVSTTPHTVGDEENFIAFCFCPIAFKQAIIFRGVDGDSWSANHSASASFVEETYKRIGVNRHGESFEAKYRFPDGPTRTDMQLIYRPAHLGVQQWRQGEEVYPTGMFSPRLPASQRGVIAKLTIPVIAGGGSYIKVNAQLYVSSHPSLYQACDKNYCLDTRIEGRGKTDLFKGDTEAVQNLFEGETFTNIGVILIGARLRAGDYILQGKRVAYEDRYMGKVIYKPQNVYRYVYEWVKYTEQTKDAHVYLPFGDNQSYAFRSWVDINSELVQVSMKEMSGGKVTYREYTKTQGLYGEGLVIPTPPAEADSVTMEVLQEVLFGHRLLVQWTSALEAFSNDYSRRVYYYNGLAYDLALADVHFALDTNVLAPAYVLMRGLSLSTVDARPGKNQSNSRITKTAKLNASGYEVLNISPLVSNDPSLPMHSPSLIRDANSTAVLPPIVRYQPWSFYPNMEILTAWGNTTELLASEAFAMHGTRRSRLEGTFRTPVEFLLGGIDRHLSYHGKRYMVLSERRDMRKGQSFLRLVEVEDVDYTPTLTFGETSENANPNYTMT